MKECVGNHMNMNRFVLLGSVFVTCLLVLCTYHAVYHDLHETYPGNEAVIFDTCCDVPVSVSIYGTVLQTSDDGFTLRITHGSASKILTVLSQEGVPPVARGDKVEVLGVRHSDELVPEMMIVLKQWSHYAVYLRSVAGLAITLVVFFRYWTFDFRALQFRRRGVRSRARRIVKKDKAGKDEKGGVKE